MVYESIDYENDITCHAVPVVLFLVFRKKNKHHCERQIDHNFPWSTLLTGLLIFRGKKGKISWDFQGQIRGKIGQFRGIFAGKKSKFAEKLADFAGF